MRMTGRRLGNEKKGGIPKHLYIATTDNARHEGHEDLIVRNARHEGHEDLIVRIEASHSCLRRQGPMREVKRQ